MPRPFVELYASVETEDWLRAQEIHFETSRFIELMGIETNPGPVKAAAEVIGLCKNELRLPLSPLNKSNYSEIKKAFKP